ncbi:MAG: C40 family peptidase [Candidatus Sumerlaeaceae bacterium]|nr:C40 family peptidase [Candidatus Sumerlaeaceae bacterium]
MDRRKWAFAALAATNFSFCIVGLGAQPLLPDYTTTAPFTPSERKLVGLVVTLDPEAETDPAFARVNDLLFMAAATLRHHLQDAGASVRLTRWDDRPSTHPTLGPVADSEHRRWHASDSRSGLVVRLTHTSAPEQAGSCVSVRLFAPEAQLEQCRALEQALTAALDAEIYHDLPARVSAVRSTEDRLVLEFSAGNLAHPGFAQWTAQTGRQRDIARGLYRAIEILASNGLGLRQGAQSLVLTAPVGPDVPEGVQPPIAALARQLWPFSARIASTTEAQWLLEQYKARVLTDTTFFYLSTRVTRDGEAWIVTGNANQPRIRAVPAQLLRAVGLEPVRDEVQLLPSERVGSKRFGVTCIPMAMTWDKPAEGDGVQTQLLLGDPVVLLDESDDRYYLLVQGHDGYTGWVRSEAIWRMDESQYAQYLNTPRATVLRDIKANGISLPAGSSLRAAESGGHPDEFVAILPGPAQQRMTLPRTAVRMGAANALGDAVASAALSRLTVPYVFGGRSGIGLDCSGLTNVAYATAGLVLPRDARQQILVGQMVAFPGFISSLKAGDLLFFIDETGRVIHTAVSLGGHRFVHASPPEVQINSLDPSDPLYSEGWTKAFALARRPFN